MTNETSPKDKIWDNYTKFLKQVNFVRQLDSQSTVTDDFIEPQFFQKCYAFEKDLDEVATKIQKLIDKNRVNYESEVLI